MQHNSNGKILLHRLSGYVTEKEKRWWEDEKKRVIELEGLRERDGMGLLFKRVAKLNLRLDTVSLAEYNKKRPRDENPARK